MSKKLKGTIAGWRKKGAIAGWEREHGHTLLSNIEFWRNKTNHGFVGINMVEKGVPAYSEGRYQVEINTPHSLDARYFPSIPSAKNFIRAWMRGHPKG